MSAERGHHLREFEWTEAAFECSLGQKFASFSLGTAIVKEVLARSEKTIQLRRTRNLLRTNNFPVKANLRGCSVDSSRGFADICPRPIDASSLCNFSAVLELIT